MPDTRTTVQTRTTVGTKVGLALVAGAAIVAAIAMVNTTNVSVVPTNTNTATSVTQPNLVFLGTASSADGGALTADGFYFVMKNGGTKDATWAAGAQVFQLDWLDASSAAVGIGYKGMTAQAKVLAAGATDAKFVLSAAPQAARDWYAARPTTARFLRITLDPAKVVSESNESDNMRNLILPNPNFAIKDAKYDTASGLSFGWSSNGSMGTGLTVKAGQFIYSLNWLRSDESEIGATLGYYAKATTDYTLAYGASGTLATSADAAAVRLWLTKRPAGAAKIKIVMDPMNTLVEANENDNSALVSIPLSDIKIMSASAVGTKFSFIYSNIGSETAYWKSGQAVYILYWLGDGDNHFLGTAYSSKATADKALVSNIPQTVDISTAELTAKAWFAARPVGAKKIRILFSPGGTYTEANPADNTMDVTLQ